MEQEIPLVHRLELGKEFPRLLEPQVVGDEARFAEARPPQAGNGAVTRRQGVEVPIETSAKNTLSASIQIRTSACVRRAASKMA